MKPDYDRAATKAAEILIQYKVSTAPVDPLPIIKATKDVVVKSFVEMSENTGLNRNELLEAFHNSQDAVTSVHVIDGKKQYLIVYNHLLSDCLRQRALARELGHIVLGHDGTLPYEIRHAEAKCFAHHLLAPRALIHAIKASGIRFTMEVFGNLTNCNDRCLGCMRYIPETHVPAQLNRDVRNNFKDCIMNFFNFQRILTPSDGTALADLGSYMEGYVE